MDCIVVRRNEYTIQLVNILTPVIYEGLDSIHCDVKAYIKGKQELKVFQILLQQIASWNKGILDNEVRRIVHKCKCDFLDDLLKAVIKANIAILSNNQNIDSITSIEKSYYNNITLHRFIHQCYIECGREFYKTPELFFQRYVSSENKNNQNLIMIGIKKSIEEAIRKMLPLNAILQEFLTRTSEQSKKVEEIAQVEPIDKVEEMELQKKPTIGNNPEKEPLADPITKLNNEVEVMNTELDKMLSSLTLSDTDELSSLGGPVENANNMVKLVQGESNDMNQTVGDTMNNPDDNVLDDAVNNAVDDAINKTVDNAVDDAVGDAMNNVVNNQADNVVSNPVGDAVNNPVDNPVNNTVGDEVNDAVGDAVNDAVGDVVSNPVDNAVDNAVDDIDDDAINKMMNKPVDVTIDNQGEAVDETINNPVDKKVGEPVVQGKTNKEQNGGYGADIQAMSKEIQNLKLKLSKMENKKHSEFTINTPIITGGSDDFESSAVVKSSLEQFISEQIKDVKKQRKQKKTRKKYLATYGKKQYSRK